MAVKAHFQKKKFESDSICTFYFEPEKPLDFIAGQFIELHIKHPSPDSRGAKRWFTVSSAPFEKYISITTKINSSGSSFKSALLSLKHGDEVKIIEPMGDFVLPRDPSIPLLFVAGGVGITPFRSIALWMAQQHEHRNVTLLHAVSTEEDIIFQDTFNGASIHSIHIVSNPSDTWGGERGQITADHILKIAEPAPDTLFYLSGPENLIATLQQDLIALKIEKSRIITDFFHNYNQY